MNEGSARRTLEAMNQSQATPERRSNVPPRPAVPADPPLAAVGAASPSEQAQTLRDAAEEGTAFCEECSQEEESETEAEEGGEPEDASGEEESESESEA